MFGKLVEAQKKAGELQQRLSAITVEGDAAQGAVRVTADGNKRIRNISITDALMNSSRKSELEDLLKHAIDSAMEKAENLSTTEMKDMMRSMMPGIGNVFGK